MIILADRLGHASQCFSQLAGLIFLDLYFGVHRLCRGPCKIRSCDNCLVRKYDQYIKIFCLFSLFVSTVVLIFRRDLLHYL